jgi:hypothetical protein
MQSLKRAGVVTAAALFLGALPAASQEPPASGAEVTMPFDGIPVRAG